MRQRWLLGWLAGLITLYLPLLVQAETANAQKALVKIALIIDDLGNHKTAGEAALALPGPVTYAFLPHTPFAWEQAERAHTLKREVMLHLPMESHEGNRLGPGALTLAMTKSEFQRTLQDALASVPHVAGINNHMGSLLTRDPTAMRWLMSAIRDDELFFIDSRTTKRTMAAKVARRNLIPFASRSVFLDNTPDRQAIQRQLQKLIRKARETGMAIGIGHPHRQTIEVLAQEIPGLLAQGVELVPVSNLTNDGSILWHASSSPSPRDVKNSKQSPSPTF